VGMPPHSVGNPKKMGRPAEPTWPPPQAPCRRSAAMYPLRGHAYYCAGHSRCLSTRAPSTASAAGFEEDPTTIADASGLSNRQQRTTPFSWRGFAFRDGSPNVWGSWHSCYEGPLVPESGLVPHTSAVHGAREIPGSHATPAV